MLKHFEPYYTKTLLFTETLENNQLERGLFVRTKLLLRTIFLQQTLVNKSAVKTFLIGKVWVALFQLYFLYRDTWLETEPSLRGSFSM